MCVCVCVCVCTGGSSYKGFVTYPFSDDEVMPSWLIVAVFQTGLPGALIVVAIGQLVPQLYGVEHPVELMSLPGAEIVVRLSMWLEWWDSTLSELLLVPQERCIRM